MGVLNKLVNISAHLFWCSNRKLPNQPQQLFECGNDRRPMHIAVRHDRDEVVGTLIALKAKGKVPNNDGLTPAELAEKLGHKLCAQLLS